MSNLSRRQFLTSIAALGLGAFTVASCTSGNTSSNGSSGKNLGGLGKGP